MKAPHVSQHRADCAAHLRALIEGAQVSQEETADALGISPRAFRRYLSGEVAAPYVVQFTVEAYCASVIDARTSPAALADESGAALARKANKLRREIESAPTAALSRQRAKRELRRIERALAKL